MFNSSFWSRYALVGDVAQVRGLVGSDGDQKGPRERIRGLRQLRDQT
jgi:hypothetical protein